MSPFWKKWIGRFGRIPPRNFWSTLIFFAHYAWIQAVHASKRARGGGDLESHINMKRTHYLEKAILCDTGRNPELDGVCNELKAYLEGPMGPEDDCYLYMMKMVREYESYPADFSCYMRDIPFKGHSEAEAKALRRIIVQRRSIRVFSETPVADAELKKVAEAGTYAPTSCNAQPLMFLSVTDRNVVREVMEAAIGAKGWADTVPTAIVIVSDRRHYKPFEQHLVMFQDIASGIQNCLLMCEALNLAACWVSLISDSHIEGETKVRSLLGLPDHYAIGGAIALGYPTNTVCHVPRRPILKMWHREKFEGQSSE